MAENNIAQFETAEVKDFMRTVMARALASVMEKEVEALTGAVLGQRSLERTASRNGYRPRSLETGLGEVVLQIPKLRKGSYFPSFLEPRRRWEKALVAVIQEAYLQGISTRAVDSLVEAMGCSGISKSQVSRLCQEIQGEVNAFLNRPLEGSYPYVWLDATYLKVREGGRIVSMAAVMAIGLNEEGRREVLGIQIGHSETQEFWTSFLRNLLDRGLRGVCLTISDAHAGLRQAIHQCMGCSWQRCRVHFMRNVLAHVKQGRKDMVASYMRTAMAEETLEETQARWDEVAANMQEHHPKVAAMMRESRDEVLAHRHFPSGLWSILASTNTLERLNGEVKRRTDVVQIFPNRASALMLVGALLMEQHDEWQVARKTTTKSLLQNAHTKGDALLARAGGKK